MSALWGLLAAAAMAGQIRSVSLPVVAFSAPRAAAPAAAVVPSSLLPASIVPQSPVAADSPTAAAGRVSLDRLTAVVAPAASLDGERPMEERFEKAFDGSAQREEQRMLAQSRQAQAVQHAHAERPVVDYFSASLDGLGAAEIAVFAALLGPLVTEKAARVDQPPDLAREDPEHYGRSEQQVRDIAVAAGFSPPEYHARLAGAYRVGLVYRLDDKKRGKTYYGVPERARLALGLTVPAPAPAARASSAAQLAEASMLSRVLPALAQQAAALGDKDELFEFTAEVLNAAAREGFLARAAVPEKFWNRAKGFDSAALKDALLTLLESSRGLPLFDGAQAACEAAVKDGALRRAELDVLR